MYYIIFLKHCIANVAFNVRDAVSDDVDDDVDCNDGEDGFGSLTELCYHFKDPRPH